MKPINSKKEFIYKILQWREKMFIEFYIIPFIPSLFFPNEIKLYNIYIYKWTG